MFCSPASIPSQICRSQFQCFYQQCANCINTMCGSLRSLSASALPLAGLETFGKIWTCKGTWSEIRRWLLIHKNAVWHQKGELRFTKGRIQVCLVACFKWLIIWGFTWFGNRLGWLCNWINTVEHILFLAKGSLNNNCHISISLVPLSHGTYKLWPRLSICTKYNLFRHMANISYEACFIQAKKTVQRQITSSCDTKAQATEYTGHNAFLVISLGA